MKNCEYRDFIPKAAFVACCRIIYCSSRKVNKSFQRQKRKISSLLRFARISNTQIRRSSVIIVRFGVSSSGFFQATASGLLQVYFLLIFFVLLSSQEIFFKIQHFYPYLRGFQSLSTRYSLERNFTDWKSSAVYILKKQKKKWLDTLWTGVILIFVW